MEALFIYFSVVYCFIFITLQGVTTVQICSLFKELLHVKMKGFLFYYIMMFFFAKLKA